MNLEFPNIWVFGGSESTKDQINTVNYYCTELLERKEPGVLVICDVLVV